MTKSRLIFVAVLLLVVAQALVAARYGLGHIGRGFYDGA
ncbi:MAG: hypothetical protein JWM60_902 [Solirubrobacterales bacterium]|jgi:hypothetical protein|nr:hypothetical protein [Solirubrobacterales bacterium]